MWYHTFSAIALNCQKQPSRGVLRKKCSENMQQVYISIKLQITLRHGCSPVNLLHIFRTPFPKNTSGRLLLNCGLRTVLDNWTLDETLMKGDEKSKCKNQRSTDCSFISILFLLMRKSHAGYCWHNIYSFHNITNSINHILMSSSLVRICKLECLLSKFTCNFYFPKSQIFAVLMGSSPRLWCSTYFLDVSRLFCYNQNRILK